MSTMTHWLAAHHAGDAAALPQLVALLYGDLQRVARGQRRRVGGADTLNTTALVHEAYAKIVDQAGARFADRGHLLAVASMAMRQILVDYARHRCRDKRGGGAVHAPLDEMDERVGRDAQHLLELDMALGRLAEHDARLARVVECRYFAGLTEEETADALEVSVRTVQREWLKARSWLRQQLRA